MPPGTCGDFDLSWEGTHSVKQKCVPHLHSPEFFI